jgi:hypothetical protein
LPEFSRKEIEAVMEKLLKSCGIGGIGYDDRSLTVAADYSRALIKRKENRLA